MYIVRAIILCSGPTHAAHWSSADQLCVCVCLLPCHPVCQPSTVHHQMAKLFDPRNEQDWAAGDPLGFERPGHSTALAQNGGPVRPPIAAQLLLACRRLICHDTLQTFPVSPMSESYDFFGAPSTSRNSSAEVAAHDLHWLLKPYRSHTGTLPKGPSD